MKGGKFWLMKSSQAMYSEAGTVPFVGNGIVMKIRAAVVELA